MKWKRLNGNTIEENKCKQKGDPKHTWKDLNDLTGKKSDVSQICSIKTSACENLKEAKDIANHFNDYFEEIGPFGIQNTNRGNRFIWISE